MARPNKIKKYEPMDLKLGIKSSLPKVKSVLALSYLIWKSGDNKTEVVYSVEQDNKIVISEDCKNNLISLLTSVFSILSINSEDFISAVNNNNLFNSQMEALIVALELVWRIAKVDWVQQRSFSAERTKVDGVEKRFAKKLVFSNNVDILDTLVDSDIDNFLCILTSWVMQKDYTQIDRAKEKLLIKMLMIMSEKTIFRIKTEDDYLTYNVLGIYEQLLNNDTVSPFDPKENKGALRIFKTAISDGLQPMLSISGDGVKATDKDYLKEYVKRLEMTLKLSTVDDNILGLTEETAKPAEHSNFSINRPHNRIIFGAPGTGKSFTLNRDRKEFFKSDDQYERVTFHPNYTYGQFVGTYKPSPLDGDKTKITYEFVEGPFIRILKKALKNPDTPYLLIIEEINRANVAAVFGDIFQLLDRNSDGCSEYSIDASEDVRKHLEQDTELLPEQTSILSIPNNMYIWASMNSADQGVFPIDTAFKRRWTFEYVDIDEGETETSAKKVIDNLTWNDIRKLINKRLESFNVNEDKLLGPFFMTKADIENDFDSNFKNKVLMYLYEDALKHKKAYSENITQYSKLLKLYDKIGLSVLGIEMPSAEELTVNDETDDTTETE